VAGLTLNEKIMTEAEKLFHELAEEIPDTTEGKMFGALCLKTPNGKSAAMFWKDNLVVKLQGDAYNEAMSLDGAKLFDPMDGRPMKEWVQIPYAYKKYWKKYALISAEGVKALPGKTAKEQKEKKAKSKSTVKTKK
jgi:hypothetical protein